MSVELKVGNVVNPFDLGLRPFDVKQAFQMFRGIKVMSWGAHAFRYKTDAWIRMKVQARRHNGHVYVLLGWDDTFTVLYTTIRGKILKIDEGVYVDVLIDTIDAEIEKVDAYHR